LVGILLVAAGVFAVMKLSKKTQAVTLEYWGLWESDNIIRPVLDEFEKQHPNIKVQYKVQSLTQYRERLKRTLSGNPGPDIFRIHNSWIPMFKENLAPVPDTIYSAKDFETLFYPAVKDTLRAGGNYLAIPLEYDGLAMYVNNDLFSQNSVIVPTSWTDLEKVAVAMSRCETEDKSCRPGSRVLTSGVALGATDNVDHWQDVLSVLLLQNNGVLMIQNGIITVTQPGQSTSYVFDYLSRFSATYGIWDSTSPSSTTLFAQGKVGVYFGPSWRVFDIKAINPNLNFSIHPIPQLPVDASRNEKPVTWASFWVEGVNVKSPHSKEAFELLKYLSSPDVLVKLQEQAKAAGRDFGEPYPRVDMADKLKSDPFVGPVINQAPNARTWYIASATSDGENGLNTLLSNSFANVLNRKSTAAGLPAELAKILGPYGINVNVSAQ
jgi:multiple sugar transport system substrate-binding protein